MSTEVAVAGSAGVITESGGEYGHTGLILPEGMEFDAWASVGSGLDMIDRAVNWWIGDWLLYGENSYGETYTQAVQETGRSRQTLTNLTSVAKRVPPEVRRATLSWTHHEAVSPLSVAQQRKILDLAEEQGWTVRQTREAVREAQGKPALTTAAKVDRADTDAVVGTDHDHEARGEVEGSMLELAAELERANGEIAELRALIAQLQSDDQAKVIATLQEKYQRLEGRLDQAIAEGNEAKKVAKSGGDLLLKIRETLGVKSNREILKALARR
jgi:hypothetical protein